jgi:hypothetical protein
MKLSNALRKTLEVQTKPTGFSPAGLGFQISALIFLKVMGSNWHGALIQ